MNSGQLGTVLVAAIATYYFVAWLLVGRKRSAGSIVVRYSPPHGFSPAVLRFLATTHIDGRTYAAIVTSLAAHGCLEITRQDGAIIVKQCRNDNASAHLADEEKTVLKDLFEWEKQAAVKPPDWKTLDKLQQLLGKQVGGKFFTRNLAWVIAGMVITGLATIWVSASSGIFGKDPFDASIACSFAGLTVAMYGGFGYLMWDRNLPAIRLAVRGMYRRRTLPLLGAFIAIYPALWYVIIRSVAPGYAGVTEAMILLNTFAPSCLRNYTREGRRIRDEIEGFRQFLAGTEQDRLQRLNEPENAVQTGSQFIPYAIALDVREAWGDALGIKSMVETQL